MASALTPDQRADRLASRQHALIRHDQALACGLTIDQIRGRVESGRWIRVTKGVYRIAGAPPSWRQAALAACLGGPAFALASHLTAAALHGWTDPPAKPHVTVSPTSSNRSALAKVHRAEVLAADRTRVGPVPTTMPARTLVDIASLGQPRLLVDIADNALCSNLVTAHTVEVAMERAEVSRGRADLLALLDDWDPVIRPGSPAEMRALRLLKQWGFGTPVKQHVIRDERGAFVARADLAWVGAKVAGEYDGRRSHGQTRWRRDEPRYAAMDRAGWTAVSIDKSDLLPGERRLRDDLERAFRRRAA